MPSAFTRLARLEIAQAQVLERSHSPSPTAKESEEHGVSSLMSQPEAKLHTGVPASATPGNVVIKSYDEEWPKPDVNVKPAASVKDVDDYEIIESDSEPPAMGDSSDEEEAEDSETRRRHRALQLPRRPRQPLQVDHDADAKEGKIHTQNLPEMKRFRGRESRHPQGKCSQNLKIGHFENLSENQDVKRKPHPDKNKLQKTSEKDDSEEIEFGDGNKGIKENLDSADEVMDVFIQGLKLAADARKALPTKRGIMSTKVEGMPAPWAPATMTIV